MVTAAAPAGLGWSGPAEFPFTATTPTSTLTFTDTSAGTASIDLLLDHVRVESVISGN